jgi:UDP-N-acetylmuramate--alanine ligase
MLRATDVSVTADSTRCVVYEEGRSVGELELGMGGRHNLLNALGAAAAARALGAEWSAIHAALKEFGGVARRFERIGEAGGIVVLDDYAHHPTEITAVLSAARAMFGGTRLVAVFQPHLYTRTRDFAREFGQALGLADSVWITDIFPARESPIKGVTGELVVDATRASGVHDVHFEPSLEVLPRLLADHLKPGDVVITLGAGSIEVVGQELLDALEAPIHA